MAAILKHDVISEIRLRQSMRIFSEYNSAKFHPDPIWNDGADENNGKKNNKMTAVLDQFLIKKVGRRVVV